MNSGFLQRMADSLASIAKTEGNLKTDIVINLRSCPFMTLRESTLSPNRWYSEDIKNDHIYTLTADGFKLMAPYARNYMLNGGFLER